MRRILALIGFLLLFSVFGAAQADSYFTCSLTAVNSYCPGSGGSAVLNGGIDTHNVYIVPVGTPGTITVLLQGSVIGDFSDAVTCGTSSTTTANLLTCSGIYTRVRVKLSVFTGFTTVNITYVGVSSVTKKGGGGVSLSASSPIVVSPNPITGTGTISCPTCSTGGVTSFNSRTGAVTPQSGDYTASLVGLGSVTNDAQTKAAIVPNTAPSAGQILAGNAGGTAYAPVTMSGSCTMTSAGVMSCSGGAPTFPVNSQSGSYQVLAADFAACKTIVQTAAVNTAITLVASGSQPTSGQCIQINNYGGGNVTITRSGQNINGSPANVVMPPGYSAFVVSDGTNYFVGLQAAFSPAQDSAVMNDVAFGGTDGVSIGHQAGTASTTGNGDIIIGHYSGNSMTSGGNNVVVGYEAGQSITNSAYNIILGYGAAPNSNGSENIIIGADSGYSYPRASTNNILVGTNTNAPSADNGNYLNIGGFLIADMSKGILIFDAVSNPTTITSNACGSTTQGTLNSGSNDISGEVTVGTTAVTSCAVSFASTHTTAPNCIVTDQSQGTVVGFGYSASTTALTVTATSAFSGTKFDYFCPLGSTTATPTP